MLLGPAVISLNVPCCGNVTTAKESVGLSISLPAKVIVSAESSSVVNDCAAAMGASRTINVMREAQSMAEYERNKGWFDVAFECSAAAGALKSAIAAVRPRGTIVQVGVTGDTPIPLNVIVGKEIVLRGTHRFHEEFAWAARLISERLIDVRPIITSTFPHADSMAAFKIAGDRSRDSAHGASTCASHIERVVALFGRRVIAAKGNQPSIG